jgi:predicted nucleic acid-binding protein
VYLADTSAWNRSKLVQDMWQALLEEDEIAICVPVRLELLWSARGTRDYTSFAHDLDYLPHVPIDGRVELVAANVQSALAERSQHRGPTAVDLLVAALAEVHGTTLLHYDRHFDAIAAITGQPAEWLARRGSLD